MNPNRLVSFGRRANVIVSESTTFQWLMMEIRLSLTGTPTRSKPLAPGLRLDVLWLEFVVDPHLVELKASDFTLVGEVRDGRKRCCSSKHRKNLRESGFPRLPLQPRCGVVYLPGLTPPQRGHRALVSDITCFERKVTKVDEVSGCHKNLSASRRPQTGGVDWGEVSAQMFQGRHGPTPSFGQIFTG